MQDQLTRIKLILDELPVTAQSAVLGTLVTHLFWTNPSHGIAFCNLVRTELEAAEVAKDFAQWRNDHGY